MGEAEQRPEVQDESTESGARSEQSPSDAMPRPEPGEVEPESYAGNLVLGMLFNTRGPVWKYMLRAGLISLVPSLFIAFFLALVGIGNEETMPQFDQAIEPAVQFAGLVIISPVLETLLLAFGLWLLSFITKHPLRQAIGSCVSWAVLHSLLASIWGLVIVWPFFVFSCAYLAWRRRSRWHAMGVACGIHMFQNLLPGILVAVT
jgi:hypothetical protein